ncbi:MAG: VWA domain-containing protein [Ancrocorticia sp.]|nr:VWA domain-containing protein [Ancrocorticia sp.]
MAKKNTRRVTTRFIGGLAALILLAGVGNSAWANDAVTPESTGQTGASNIEANAVPIAADTTADDEAPTATASAEPTEAETVATASPETTVAADDPEVETEAGASEPAGGTSAAKDSTPATETTTVGEDSGEDVGDTTSANTDAGGTPARSVAEAAEETENIKISPMVAGPETGITAPYLYWEAVYAGSLIGGATFYLQGPRTGANWGTTYTVVDCQTEACSGPDLDPDPGEFLVKYLDAGQSTPVDTDNRYRVQLSAAPSGYVGSNSSSRVTIPNGSAQGQNDGDWNDGQGVGTHDFGQFQLTRSGYATIVVEVGGDRNGLTAIDGLAGVVLTLWDGNQNGPTAERTEGWATCTSDANGTCVFEVPITGAGGVGNSFRPWVVQESVPSGWFMNTAFRTGSGNTGDSQATKYQFRLNDELESGTTYRSTVTGTNGFMVASGNDNRSASGGTWQVSRENPTLPAQCGLDIALVLDLSGSVENQGQLANLKTAATSITNSLVGTQSRAAVFSFSNSSPATGATQNYPALTSVATQAQADAFTQRWQSWSATGGTNWDRALATVAQASATYDVVVVITDGNPTFYQSEEGPGYFTRVREMENAVFSANAIKAEGTRVLAVGVGSGVTDSTTGLNLAAISGIQLYSSDSGNILTADYFQESSYEAAAEAIRAMALGNCASTISVTKMIAPEDTEGEDVTGAVTAPAGWTFTAATDEATLSSSTQTTIADGTGTVNFPLEMESTTSSATVTIAEEQQTGYTLVTQDEARAVCTRLDTGAGVTVTNDPASLYGFSVDVPSTTGVACTVYNRAPSPQASVVLEKQWVINGAEPVADGEQSSDFKATGLLSGPDNTTLTEQGWEVERTGYSAGDSVVIDETYSIADRLLCEVTDASITAIGGQQTDYDLLGDATYTITSLSAGQTVVQITNTIKCETKLTLRKRVAEGDAEPTEWTLTAIAPDGALPGPTGTSGSLSDSDATSEDKDPTALITPGVTYQLAESGGPAEYLQTDQRTVQGDGTLLNPKSTGSWTCHQVVWNEETQSYDELSGFADGIQGGVTAGLGQHIRCTANNETAQLTLLKGVINDDGGQAESSDFTLTATPSSTPTVEGLDAQSVTGLDDAAVSYTAATINVRPEHDYTLSETTLAGYEYTKLQQRVNGEWVDVEKDVVVNLDAGDAATYRFVNDDQPGSVIWSKVDEADNLLSNAEWELTGPSGFNDDEALAITDCVEDSAESCIGPDTDPAAGKFKVVDLPWGDYTLTETIAPAGYYPASEIPFTVGVGEDVVLDVALGDVVNTPIEGPDLPFTGGLLSRDLFAITGAGVLALGLGALAFVQIRNRRRGGARTTR